MSSLISFNISSDFGFFKKPDLNKVSLTYTFPPRTCILGILGSILGFSGFKKQYYNEEDFPEYYKKLSHLKIGVSPGENFPFEKIMNKYNNSTGHASEEEGGNLIVEDQLLVNPKYKIYVFSQKDDILFKKIKNMLSKEKTIYTPYLGKNDFPIHISNYKEVIFKKNKPENDFVINTIFLLKELPKGRNDDKLIRSNFELKGAFDDDVVFYENYPVGYDENMQYDVQLISYTTRRVNKSIVELKRGEILLTKDEEYIYVF